MVYHTVIEIILYLQHVQSAVAVVMSLLRLRHRFNARFPIETVSLPGNSIENDTVSKSLHGTYPTVKSNRLCQGDLFLRPLRFVNWS